MIGSGMAIVVRAEDAGSVHAESLVLGSSFGRCRFRLRIGFAWRPGLVGKRLIEMVSSGVSSETRNL